MLLKTLKGRHYLLLVFVPILILLLWFKAFMNPVSLTGSHPQMPIYSLLQSITGDSLIALNIIGYLILAFLSLMMVRLNERYVFIRQRTDLPAFVFALIATGTVSLYGMHPSLIASLLLFFAIERVFGIYHGLSTLAKSFDAGMLIGLASLVYVFAGVYLIWFWLSLAFLGYFRGREILAGLVGFILPVFIAVSWFYLNGNLEELIQTFKALLSQNLGAEYSLYQKVFWLVIGFLVLISSAFMTRVVEEKKISSRKYFTILLIFFLCTITSFLLFNGAGVELYFITLIPVTYIISHYFVLSKYSWMMEVLFVIFVLSGILIHFMA